MNLKGSSSTTIMLSKSLIGPILKKPQRKEKYVDMKI